ncbi:hypothetical protein OIO90_004958 [Microbotryomycetes sp. JL221]|nr:hypothetical protein OIO90_004958 [Microbotryomycetes sp. JL221]
MSTRTSLTRALEMQEREKDQLEIIALQREALASATELVAALQRRLRLMETSRTASTPVPHFGLAIPSSTSTSTSTSPTLSATSSNLSAPPASTSLTAALRLQILGRGLQQTTLARRVEQVESRSQSRNATPRQGRSPVVSDDELSSSDDDDDMEEDKDDDILLSVSSGGVVGARIDDNVVANESNYRAWVAEQLLSKGLVDENGVRVKNKRRRLVKRRYSAGR